VDGSFQRTSYQYPTLRLRTGARFTGVLTGALLGTLTGAVRPLPYEDLWIATVCIRSPPLRLRGTNTRALFGVSKLSGVGYNQPTTLLSHAYPPHFPSPLPFTTTSNTTQQITRETTARRANLKGTRPITRPTDRPTQTPSTATDSVNTARKMA
jgi:hypothetical protein